MADRSEQTSGFRPSAVRGIFILLGMAVLTTVAGYRPAAAQAEPERAPCQQIRAACTDAGFKPGGAPEGIGIQVDCIRPIMQGTAQRTKAAKALPQIDASLVAACKARNPKFGQDATKPE
jgi:hypothetical protein